MQAVFKALSDPSRRKILDMLKERDLNAGEIADAFNMTKPSISHHLELLHQANLISRVKHGQFVVYSLNTTIVDELLEWLITLNQRT